MKITTIVNGRISLAISPESEIEKQILNELFKGPVDVQIMDKVQILNNALVDSVLISPVKKESISPTETTKG